MIVCSSCMEVVVVCSSGMNVVSVCSSVEVVTVHNSGMVEL